jgi:glyoxylase-like metal-dependent hydrolase (beta-lactamase superfamily II)
MLTSQSQPVGKVPHLVLDNIFAFAPNRDTLGGTAYFIVNNTGNIMIDAPAWSVANQEFIAAQNGVKWLLITHRGGLGQTAKICKELGCTVVIQEQEAYLLPDIPTTTYYQQWQLGEDLEAIWTPGHSPGSACVYYGVQGGILFTGRHLLPDRDGQPRPLQTAKTFHWPRQVKNVKLLADQFSVEQLRYILPGASSGLLRGKGYIDLQEVGYFC